MLITMGGIIKSMNTDNYNVIGLYKSKSALPLRLVQVYVAIVATPKLKPKGL